MIRYALPFLAIAAIGSAALAEDTDAPKAEKRICRGEEQTASRLRRKTCHTAAQWKVIDEANQKAAANMLNRNSRNETGGN